MVIDSPGHCLDLSSSTIKHHAHMYTFTTCGTGEESVYHHGHILLFIQPLKPSDAPSQMRDFNRATADFKDMHSVRCKPINRTQPHTLVAFIHDIRIHTAISVALRNMNY